MDPNAEQRTQWNEGSGTNWAALQPDLDRQMAPVRDEAVGRLPLRPGNAVLDVGCGCGDTTLLLGEKVGSAGRAVGIDLSAPMLAVAEERARRLGLDQVRFLNADAQTEAIPDAPYDAVFSRFGVMFFADDLAAFRNLGKALKPGAPLLFACWQRADDNPWATVPFAAVQALVPDAPPSPPDAPGPFRYGDPDRLRRPLEEAGFTEVAFDSYRFRMGLGGHAVLEDAAEFATRVGPASRLLRGASPEVLEEALRRLREVLGAHRDDRGQIALDAAIWMISARWTGAG